MADPVLAPVLASMAIDLVKPMGAQRLAGFVITGTLILFAVLLARRRGYSPLEIFSRKADAHLGASCEDGSRWAAPSEYSRRHLLRRKELAM